MFAAQSIVTGVVADVIQTVDVTVDTTPPVDSFLLDGIAHVAPFVFEGVIGADHEVSVAPEICIEGSRYRFQGWSDSGAATHVFTVPAAPTSLIAMYGNDGPCSRVTTGLQVIYGFAAGVGTTVRDHSGHEPALDLTIANTSAAAWMPSGGLSIAGPTVLATGGPATRLRDALRASGNVTLEAWVRPGDLSGLSSGPARIVALSQNGFPAGGNLVLGQSLGGSSEYVARVRTSVSNQYGSPDFPSPIDSATSSLTHVVYTRSSSGEEKFYLDAIEVGQGFRPGALTNWGDYVLALANEPEGGRPWLGELWLVAIYDRVLGIDDLSRNFVAGPILDAKPAPAQLTIDTAPWIEKPLIEPAINRGFAGMAATPESVSPTYRIPFIADDQLTDDNPFDVVPNYGTGQLLQAPDGEMALHVNPERGISFPVWDGARSPSLSNRAWTIFLDLDIIATVGSYPAIIAKRGNTMSGFWQLYRVDDGPDMSFAWKDDGIFRSVVFSNGWPGPGRHQIVLTRNNGSYVYYVDGLQRGQAFDPNPVPSGVGLHNLTLGVLQHDSPGTNRLEARYHNVWVNVYRAITNSDVAGLAANAWQIYSQTRLPNGVVGKAYPSLTLTASGGVEPFTWSIAGGSLPPGLTMSAAGNISGVATLATTDFFIVRVTDADAITESLEMQITVTEPSGSGGCTNCHRTASF